MNEQQVLDILTRLEQFRKDVESGKSKGGNDWIIRVCQAEVARGHFETRMEWTTKIN